MSNRIVSYIIKIIWCVVFLLIIFLKRENEIMVGITIILLILISLVTVIRSLNSRNEWRQMIKNGEVEIKDKIGFDE